MLYKIEFAIRVGLVDVACTEKACSWNKSTVEVEPRPICEVEIEKHNRKNEEKKRKVIWGQTDGHGRRECARIETYLENVHRKEPDAVFLMTFDPPKDFACPQTLPDIANVLLDANQMLISKHCLDSLRRSSPSTRASWTSWKINKGPGYFTSVEVTKDRMHYGYKDKWCVPQTQITWKEVKNNQS